MRQFLYPGIKTAGAEIAGGAAAGCGTSDRQALLGQFFEAGDKYRGYSGLDAAILNEPGSKVVGIAWQERERIRMDA